MIRLLRRLQYLLQRDRPARELDDELRFHLEMKRQELESRGLDAAAAATAARRALGNLPLTRDHVRDVWIAPWLQSVVQDVRFAGRLFVKQRGFTLGVVLVLGVGIALTSAMYTVVNSILFTGLPGDDDGRIVSLGTRDELGRPAGVSLPDFEEWGEANETFEGIAAMFPIGLNVSDHDTAAEFVFGAYVSHDTFRLLRISPVLGRDFLPEDALDGAPGTAILSHRLWMSRYDGNPEVIGRTIRLNDRPSVLIGVMPERFEFPHSIAIWTPLGPRFGGSAQGRAARTHQAFGRLAAGVSLARAQADLEVVAARLAEEYRETNAGIRPTVASFTQQFVPDWTKQLLFALLGGVVFVLLIACANVANLLLSRSARRGREMSLRVSLGATRGRLVRQLLVETLLLTGLAGLAGVALSGLAVRLVTIHLGTAPYWIDYTMDGRVLGLVVATCLATGLACGLVPALQVSKTNVSDRLKDGGRAGGGLGSVYIHRWTTGLLTSEIALTLILLAGGRPDGAELSRAPWRDQRRRRGRAHDHGDQVVARQVSHHRRTPPLLWRGREPAGRHERGGSLYVGQCRSVRLRVPSITRHRRPAGRYRRYGPRRDIRHRRTGLLQDPRPADPSRTCLHAARRDRGTRERHRERAVRVAVLSRRRSHRPTDPVDELERHRTGAAVVDHRRRVDNRPSDVPDGHPGPGRLLPLPR